MKRAMFESTYHKSLACFFFDFWCPTPFVRAARRLRGSALSTTLRQRATCDPTRARAAINETLLLRSPRMLLCLCFLKSIEKLRFQVRSQHASSTASRIGKARNDSSTRSDYKFSEPKIQATLIYTQRHF